MPCLFCWNLDGPGIFKPHHQCRLLDGAPCAACKEAQELESQIIEAKDALYKMLVRHREIRTKMNHSHDPIVPQLPPEIVSYIFELSVPERSPEKSSHGLTKKEMRAPLILGAVCQVWRQIAFSAPQIWTSISIYLGNKGKPAKSWRMQCELAQEWLGRSGKLPLSVCMFGDENPGGTNAAPLMELINRHSSRWDHLEIDLPQRLVSLLRGDLSGASILRTLRLCCSGMLGIRALDNHSFTLKNVKPSPTSISLVGWPLNKVDIEWNHATHVNLGLADISECIEVLRRATQLICFKFTDAMNVVSSNFRPYDLPATPIIRPLLRELEIGVYTMDIGAKFVDSFILAGLEILTFSCTQGSNSLPTNSLISLINRSSCLLTTLSIQKHTIENAEILPLLRATPSVQNLHFCQLLDVAFVNALETVTLAFNSKPEEGVPPTLEMICFSGMYRMKELFPWSLVSKMFGPVSEIHSPHRRPLSKFNIAFTQYRELTPSLYIDKESIQHFLELKEVGISLDFTILHRSFTKRVCNAEEQDLLELSIVHHGTIDKPSPFSNLPS